MSESEPNERVAPGKNIPAIVTTQPELDCSDPALKISPVLPRELTGGLLHRDGGNLLLLVPPSQCMRVLRHAQSHRAQIRVANAVQRLGGPSQPLSAAASGSDAMQEEQDWIVPPVDPVRGSRETQRRVPEGTGQVTRLSADPLWPTCQR